MGGNQGTTENQNLAKITPQDRVTLLPDTGHHRALMALPRVESILCCLVLLHHLLQAQGPGGASGWPGTCCLPRSGLWGSGTARIWLSGSRGRCESYQDNDSFSIYGSETLPHKVTVICTFPQRKAPIAWVLVSGVATSMSLSSSLSCPLL